MRLVLGWAKRQVSARVSDVVLVIANFEVLPQSSCVDRSLALPEKVRVPVVRRQPGASESLQWEEIPVFMPHKILLAISMRHPEIWADLVRLGECQRFWRELSADDPKLHNSPVLGRERWQDRCRCPTVCCL